MHPFRVKPILFRFQEGRVRHRTPLWLIGDHIFDSGADCRDISDRDNAADLIVNEFDDTRASGCDCRYSGAKCFDYGEGECFPAGCQEKEVGCGEMQMRLRGATYERKHV